MPKLDFNGFQNKFNRQRDNSYSNGRCMRAVLSPDAPRDHDEASPLKTGLKMVNKDTMPNFRLNSSEKQDMTSTFNQLF